MVNYRTEETKKAREGNLIHHFENVRKDKLQRVREFVNTADQGEGVPYADVDKWILKMWGNSDATRAQIISNVILANDFCLKKGYIGLSLLR